MSAALEELEEAYRDRARQAGRRQVIVSMHLDESAVRELRPRLESAGVSLSEMVRHLILSEVRNVVS